MNSYLLRAARAALLLSALGGSGYFTFKYAPSEAKELGQPPRGGCVTAIKVWPEYSGGGTRSNTHYVVDYIFSDGEHGAQPIKKEDYARTKTGDKLALTWKVLEVRGLFSERRMWAANFSKGCK